MSGWTIRPIVHSSCIPIEILIIIMLLRAGRNPSLQWFVFHSHRKNSLHGEQNGLLWVREMTCMWNSPCYINTNMMVCSGALSGRSCCLYKLLDKQLLSELLNVSGLHSNCASFSYCYWPLKALDNANRCLPLYADTHTIYAAVNSCLEQFAVQYLDQGHFDMETAGAADGIIDLPARGRPLFLLSHSCSTAS